MIASPTPLLRLEGNGAHAGQPVLHAGEPLGRARAALILIHGRGARAEDILPLSDELAMPGFAFLAPQAAGNLWYPNRYDSPLLSNEPWLSSALTGIASLIARLEQYGIPSERLVLAGFSQGACLSAEFAVRHARRYGGVGILAGGLIGPRETPHDYPGNLDGTPAFFGCSDPDPYFTPEWIRYSAAVYERMDARIDMRIYPDLGHTINLDMIQALRAIMEQI